MLALSPFLAGLKPRDGGRFSALVGAALAPAFGFLALLGAGDHRHSEPLQVAALVTSLLWLPLLAEHWRRFDWPAGSRKWLGAMAAWGAVLAASGLLAGLPGTAEKIKYTNVLVAHVHAAAAGVVTAWLFVVLAALAEKRGLPPRRRRLFADGRAFWSWQAGTALQVGALFVVGWAEGRDPQILWSGAPLVAAGYGRAPRRRSADGCGRMALAGRPPTASGRPCPSGQGRPRRGRPSHGSWLRPALKY